MIQIQYIITKNKFESRQSQMHVFLVYLYKCKLLVLVRVYFIVSYSKLLSSEVHILCPEPLPDWLLRGMINKLADKTYI